MFGIQGGFTTKDDKGFYGDMITPANSYISIKKGGTELRGLPANNLIQIPFGGDAPKYGDFAPQLRLIQDIRPYRGVMIQGELLMGQGVEIGIRGKKEWHLGFTPMSVEVVGGARFKLKWLGLISAFLK